MQKTLLKALKIKPDSDDVRYNLAIINNQLVDQQFIEKPYKRTHIFGANKLVVQNIILIISVIILIMIYKRITKQLSKRYDRIALIGIIIWITASTSAIFWEYYDKDFGIIITEKTQVYSGPSKTQKGLFFVHQGAEFNIIHSGEYWIEVQFVNGLTGWVERNSATII